jgi:hypothetical protein
MSERAGEIVTLSNISHDNPSVNLNDEQAPVYRAGEQATETTVDLDAMFRELRRRLNGLEQLQAENRALRYQLSAAHCQVGAATGLLRLLLVSHMATDKDIAEYEARFEHIGEIVFPHE